MLQNLIDILTAPTAAFKRLKETPVFWLPLLLIVVMTISSQLGYFYHNRPGFVRGEIVDQALASRELTKEQQKQVEDTYSKVSIDLLAAATVGSVLIILPVVQCLMAWYLGFMARFNFVDLSFRHWLAFQCWTTIPAMLAVLAAWAIMLSDSTGELGQRDLQPLSIVNLLGLHTKSATLQQLNVLQLWSLALSALGYRQWTNASWLKASLTVAAPSFVIYGLIAYFTR